MLKRGCGPLLMPNTLARMGVAVGRQRFFVFVALAAVTTISLGGCAVTPRETVQTAPVVPVESSTATTDPQAAAIADVISDEFDGRAHDIHVIAADDIVVPDDQEESGSHLAQGYRATFKLDELPLTLHLHTRGVAQLSEDPDERLQEAFPSSAGLSVSEFAAVLEAFVAGSRRSDFYGMLNMTQVSDDPLVYNGAPYPAADCFALASWQVADDGILGAGIRANHHLVYLDRATGDATYLGEYSERDSGQ